MASCYMHGHPAGTCDSFTQLVAQKPSLTQRPHSNEMSGHACQPPTHAQLASTRVAAHAWQHMQLARHAHHSSAVHQPGAWGSPQVLSTHASMHTHVHAHTEWCKHALYVCRHMRAHCSCFGVYLDGPQRPLLKLPTPISLSLLVASCSPLASCHCPCTVAPCSPFPSSPTTPRCSF